VDTAEQWTEERFIALEMACAETELEHADLDKQFSGLKLEVSRLNRFTEREMMVNLQGKAGIFSNIELAFAHPASTTAANGPDGHRVDTHTRDREIGWNPPNLTSRPMVRPNPVLFSMVLSSFLMVRIAHRVSPILSQFG
jgi:hypothetical protein